MSQYRPVGEDCDVSKSARSQQSHNISEVVSARSRYSASVLERAAKVCFLLRQDIRESPRKIQNIKSTKRCISNSKKIKDKKNKNTINNVKKNISSNTT